MAHLTAPVKRVAGKLTKRIGIFVFDGVEELDFVGPLEVFGVAGRLRPDTFQPFTIGVDGSEVRGSLGLRVKPDRNFRDSRDFEILVVPGGRGTSTEMRRPETLEFVRRSTQSCELVLSVCTGALILASAGLLAGKKATTHWAHLDELETFEDVKVEHRRYIRQGRIITSAGITSGIDMALHVVEELFGPALKIETAAMLEYPTLVNYSSARRLRNPARS